MRALAIRNFLLFVSCFLLGAPSLLQAQPQMETLGRGVIAVRSSSTQVYVSWRLLASDPETVAFNVYRSIGGAAATKLNPSPLTSTTDYRDTPTSTAFNSTLDYHVRAVIGGVEQAPSPAFTVPASAPVQQFLTIPLDVPPGGTTPTGEAYTYTPNDAAPADLDGDGEYEIVLKWEPTNAKDNSQGGYTGPVYLDGYRLNGTRLWRINLGINIRAGAHYTQFIAYDLDGDGRAEVACKTAPGTYDGAGNAVLLPGDNAASDYRNSSGYILTGPEYLTVFDGLTGAALATTAYLPGRGTVSNWGDSYGNRVDRFVAGVAYVDGQRPSLIMCRGYYTQTHLVAWDWRNGQLSNRWTFSAANNTPYAGQGNHQLSVSDVDNDGRQEIVYGAMVVDDNGTGLHTTGLGHGDALHVSDFRPSRAGQEVFSPFEGPGSNGNIGTALRDARTGERLWTTFATTDVGRGVMTDIDPRYPGGEGWATNNSNIYSAYGAIIATKPSNMFHNFAVWWDADPQRELLDGGTISDWNINTSGRSNLISGAGVSSNNGTKSTPALSGDFLGDWREEVIWRRSDNAALVLYTTTISATDRRVTFLQDPQYRVALAWQNVAYNQPPHPSFNVASTPAFWTGGSSATWSSSTASWSRQVPTATATTLRTTDTAVLAPASALTLSLSGTVPVGHLISESAAEVTIDGAGTLSSTGTWNHAGPGILRWSATGSFSTWANAFAGRSVFSFNAQLTTPRLQVHPGASLGGSGRVVGTLDLRAGSGLLLDPTGPFRVTGNLDAPGAVTLSAVPGSTVTPGTYTFLTYSGSLTGTPTFAWSGAGLSATFDTSTPGQFRVTLTQAAVIGQDVLQWGGLLSSIWDFATDNWIGLGGVTVFENGDLARFVGAPANRTFTLDDTVLPASVEIDSSSNWTLSGVGAIGGTGTLTKQGTGTFAIATANTFSGGSRIEAGTLTASHASALGTGAITLAGGTLGMGTLTLNNAIVVDTFGRITGGSSGGTHGIKAVSGSGVLEAEATNVFDFEGSLANFNGRVSLLGTGSFRFFGSNGSSISDFDLGTRSLNARSGSAFNLGSLSGLEGSFLSGASGSGNNTIVTYTIGANGADSQFAGVIADGNRATNIVKTGNGRLTLTGISTYTGTTNVQAGRLDLNGSIGTGTVTVQTGAALGGTGSLGGNLTLSTGTTLYDTAGEESLVVAGNVILNGPVTVLAAADPFEEGVQVVLTYAGTLSGQQHFTWTPPVGSNLQGSFDFSSPGQVRLVVSRILSALEQWRVTHFGSPSAAGSGGDNEDPDLDGRANLIEYAFGKLPLVADNAPAFGIQPYGDGRFALTFDRIADPSLVYEVLATDSPTGTWTPVWSSTGAANMAGVVTAPDAPEAIGVLPRYLRLRVTLATP